MRTRHRLAVAVAFVACGAAIAVVAVGADGIAPSGADSSMGPDNLPALPADLLHRMSAPAARVVMTRSLLAVPALKEQIARYAANHGLGPDKLAGLESFPLAELTRADGISLISTGDADLLRVAWKTGVTYAPSAVPTYGAQRWPLGALDVWKAKVLSWRPGVTYFPVTRTPRLAEGLIDLRAELPPEPALYMIALRLVRPDGACPAGWVRAGGEGKAPLRLIVAPDREVPLTPLLDGTGYVGLCMLPAQDATLPGDGHGMREINVEMGVMLGGWYATPPDSLGVVAFTGITIARF